MNPADLFPGPIVPLAARAVDAVSSAAVPGSQPIASRRTFLGCAAAATAALPMAAAPAGGFAGGGERLRVGLVGCGGRGTGAALQAAASNPAVRIVALGDVFAEQVESAAEQLVRRAGTQFECPPSRRFVGAEAFRGVIGGDVDLVILAGPPHVRPLHLEAAVAAGRHVYCERPVAVDVAGVVRAAAAAARGRAAGLALVSGFCSRRDEATRELVARIHAGEIGRPLELHAHAAIGLPWRQPAQTGGSAAAWRQRNWISFTSLSGGHLVEHHVDAIDRALWVLGDVAPLSAEAVATAAGVDAGAIGDCAATTVVRYQFADGVTFEASIDRRQRVRDRRIEQVVGPKGRCDLVRGLVGAVAAGAVPGGPGRHQAAMDGLVGAVLAGRAVHDGATMCLSTLVAIMGRTAAERRGRIDWDEFVGSALPPA